ncbi:lipopolysaccharide assembly protein LapA domain-containing protein [Pseudooceanicola onchidii]|uniref:lipopolysaccharide assembly protein LapA domain-containing protein n=1 Tax=Pseudooceanicola onchidii TaxID=2562279 RepID=UPI0010A9C627|nr:LapA family protein [Pseudooceanicola onchidii]
MRYIRYLILAVIGVALIAVALANRDLVTLTLLPEGLARVVGMNQSIQLPLFVVIFGGVVAGVLIGFIWEWLREHKHRAEVSRKSKEVGKLEREVKKLKGEKHQGKDEVLALLD